jgi:hypothetical protein
MQGYVINNIDYSEKKGDFRLRGNNKKRSLWHKKGDAGTSPA